MMGCKIFDVDTLAKVLAFYVLQSLPASYQIISNSIYQSTEMSGIVPSLDKVLSEIKISFSRRLDSAQNLSALKPQGSHKSRPNCKNGRHNPLAPHSEDECFETHPEKLEEFRAQKGAREQGKGGSPQIFSALQAKASRETAILDNGASYSLFKDKSRFISTSVTRIPLSLADGSSIIATEIGTVIISASDGSPIHLSNSLVIPSVNTPLIALSPFLKKHCLLIGMGDSVKLISKDGNPLLEGSLKDKVVSINLKGSSINKINTPVNLIIIHKALGHPSLKYSRKMRPDIDFSSIKCKVCLISKSHHLPFQGEFASPQSLLQVIHLDLCGPITPMSKGVVADNGGEFTSNECKRLLEVSGIQSTLTAPHTPQQNPFSERANRSLLEPSRCLLLDSKLPHHWWGESISTATYLLNRTPVAFLHFQTPFELLFGKKPKMPNLHPFGCLVYINIDKCNISSKLNPRANKGLFLGYLEGHKNFKLFNLDTSKYQVTHDCMFLDDCPGYTHFLNEASPDSISPFYLENDLLRRNGGLSVSPSSSEHVPCASPTRTSISSLSSLGPVPCTSAPSSHICPSLTSKPLDDTCSAELGAGEVKKTYLRAGLWITLHHEIGSIEENNVWIPVKIPPGANALGSTWVFCEKEDQFGNVVRHKARLCVHGLCASRNYDIDQMDVKTLFLHGITEEEVFMRYQHGFPHWMEEGTCLKLVKSLYCLKKSPQCWYKRLSELFNTLVFEVNDADPCLFVKWEGIDPIMVFIHVDNMVIGGDSALVLKFKKEIQKYFKMEDLGEIVYVLGIKIMRTQKDRTIYLSQDLYIHKILEEFGMLNCKAVSTPMNPRCRLSPSNLSSSNDSFEYRKAVGLLNYLFTCTRPDLAYSTSSLSQFLDSPSNDHVAAFKRILRYLQGTKDFSLILGGSNPSSTISGFADSDWGRNYDGKSFSGFGVLFEGLIKGKPRKN
ncbi:hypothetical protein O181_022309 [Austropuccinia psidii MF-1]|uniref:Integrase catalytic domain-containing protein n=1 Tax=Austropuccinia psidii MF-1 TaxID=1389203 RepID=A0A9Q3CCD5_9BASI|nr:hypothetical protein [Austropuccinia psidii MF-1]